MIGAGAREEALGHPLVAALGEIVAPEIAAAHVDADDDVGRAGRDRAVDGIDIALDQRVGIAARARDPVADRGIAEQRNGDLVDLQVAAAGLHQVGDLLREHGDEIGEEAIGIGIGAARRRSRRSARSAWSRAPAA